MTRFLDNIMAKDLLTHFSPMKLIEIVNWLYDEHDHMMADGLVEYLVETFILDSEGKQNVYEYERYKTVWAGLNYAGKRSLQYHLPGAAKSKFQECELAIRRCFDE